MWISAAVVIITLLVLLEPVEEVAAGHSRLVIHTPQRIKTIHRYHTSEHYAKSFGYHEYRYHPPKKKPKRIKSHRPHKRRRPTRYRKRYHRKIGRRTPISKSYGMYNYARNYRNWAPTTRRPMRRYRDSYLPAYNSQESKESAEVTSAEDDSYFPEHYDQDEESSSSQEADIPFHNEIKAIDKYAHRNRIIDKGTAYDNSREHTRDVWGNGENQDDYQVDSEVGGSHVQGYSTLPDEFLNPPKTNTRKHEHESELLNPPKANTRKHEQESEFLNPPKANTRKHEQETEFLNPPKANSEHGFRSNTRKHEQNRNNGGRRESQFNNNFQSHESDFGTGHSSGFDNSEPRPRFNRDNSPPRRDNRLPTPGFNRGQDSRFRQQEPPLKQEIRPSSQNTRGGSRIQFKNQHFEDDHDIGFKAQTSIHGSGFNTQNFGTGFTTHITHPPSIPKLKTQNFGNVQDTRPKGENFGSVRDSIFRTQNYPNIGFKTQTSGRIREAASENHNFRHEEDTRFNAGERHRDQQSGSGVFGFESGSKHRETDFGASQDQSDSLRPQRGSDRGVETISITSARPQAEDAYLKAFRAFSFRKGLTQTSGIRDQRHSSDTGLLHSPTRLQPTNIHSERDNNWGSHSTRQNADHDIGFLEGLEDLNDDVGV